MKTIKLIAFVIVSSIITSPAIAAKIKDVITPDMLGVDVKYFESKVGVARNTYDNQKSYRVGKCDFTVGTSGDSVGWFDVPNTPACSFDPYPFIYNFNGKKTPFSKMTFGSFEAIAQGKGVFFSSCISSCGNAADPSFYEQWEGPRSDSFIEVRVEAKIVGLDALSANSQLREYLAKTETDDWMMWNEFSCSTDGKKYFGVARQLFKDVKITSIAVGHGLPKPYMCK